MITSLLTIIYIIIVKPFNDSLIYYLELFNELTTLAISYHLLLSHPWFLFTGDDEVSERIGMIAVEVVQKISAILNTARTSSSSSSSPPSSSSPAAISSHWLSYPILWNQFNSIDLLAVFTFLL